MIKLHIDLNYDSFDSISEIIFEFVTMNDIECIVDKKSDCLTIKIESKKLISRQLITAIQSVKNIYKNAQITIDQNDYAIYKEFSELLLLAKIHNHKDVFDHLNKIALSANLESTLNLNTK